MTSNHPKTILDQGSMSVAQWVAVLVMVGLNALDGFDILSISFASPGIATDWGIDKATLGWVLSMELIGMGVGSIFLGGVADKIGRRPTILGCLVAMTIGMLGAGHAADVQTLSIWRLLTGLGIGGMLAAISAATAECSNLRWRSVAMALMVIGYPLGGVIGGLAVQNLLVTGTWHDIFIWGAWCTAAFIPIVWFLLPESVSFLVRQKKSGTLERINRILTRFQHAQVDVLADDATQVVKTSVTDILKPALLLTTVLITFAYFAHVVSFYFIIKWVPKIVVDMGFAPAAAAGVLMWANVGGATGGVIFGLIATRVGLKPLTVVTLLGSFALVIWFGRGATDLTTLATMVAIVGLFTNGSIVGLYSLFAKVFPTQVRATGTGFAIGVGRAGAALAPALGGYLFQAGLDLQTVAIIMGTGSLLAAAALLALKVKVE